MGRFVLLVYLIAAAADAFPPSQTEAQNPSSFSGLGGVWTLNPSLSEMPREIGFDVAWLPSSGPGGQSAPPSSGGRGRRGGGGRGFPGSPYMPRESYEDAQRVQLLTAEARNPPKRLMLVDTSSAITITNELGQSRVLHPNGKEESIELQGVSMVVTTKRDRDRVVAVYRVEQDREVRYTYSRSADPAQLIVEVQFLDHGAGDKARRVYEPGITTETLTGSASAASPPTPTAPSAPIGQPPAENVDARPGAELRGLKSLGILVEDLSTQATACGLNHDALEDVLSKRLSAGGFTVRTNADEDTYVYVNVMTNTLSDGTCVSRYDAFLYTHATASLSYHDRPVLVQVSLMHRGGIGNSAPTGHAAAVTRGLGNYIDLFITQIRDANK